MKKHLKKIFLVISILFVLILSYWGGYLYYQKNILKPHIVLLKGGLGNQMFQYAFAKSLENNTHRKVLFNKAYYYFDKRNYELGIFNLNIKFKTHSQSIKNNKFITENNPFLYEPSLYRYKKPIFFIGFFQNEKYFKNISSQIKKDFNFPEISDDDKFNQHWINEIKKAQNPVFIHIRRDDYLKLNWELPTSYYVDAIKYIEKHVENPTYFVFGLNSANFLKKKLKLKVPYVVIDDTNHTNNQDWKDMMLMSKCKHAIIANSTFSWWAAWLGPNQNGGIVVAPSPFVLGQDDIICDNWVKIKREYKSKP